MENQNQDKKKMMFTIKQWHKMLLGGVVVAVFGALSAVAVHSLVVSADNGYLIDPTGLSDDAMADGADTAKEIAVLKVELLDNSKKKEDLETQRDDAIKAVNKEFDLKVTPYEQNIEHTGGEIQRLKALYEQLTGVPYDSVFK